MAKKRHSQVIGSLPVVSDKCLKRGKAEVMPAFKPIIRTCSQAQRGIATSLNHDERSEHTNDLHGPKKHVKWWTGDVSIHTSMPTSIKKPYSHNPQYSTVVPCSEMEERNDKKMRKALVGDSDPVEVSTMQKKDNEVNDQGVPGTVNSLELMADKEEAFNTNVETHESATQNKDDNIVDDKGTSETVNDSGLMAAQKEDLKKKVATEASAIQKKVEDAVNGPSKGVARSFDMDVNSVVTLDSLDLPFYIELTGLHYEFCDVPGDGNCFLHTLAKIPAVPFSSTQEVRNAVVSYVLHGRAGDYRLKPTATREVVQP